MATYTLTYMSNQQILTVTYIMSQSMQKTVREVAHTANGSELKESAVNPGISVHIRNH